MAHLHALHTCIYGITFFGTPHSDSSKAQLNPQIMVSLVAPKQALQTDLQALEEGSEVFEYVTDQSGPLLHCL